MNDNEKLKEEIYKKDQKNRLYHANKKKLMNTYTNPAPVSSEGYIISLMENLMEEVDRP